MKRFLPVAAVLGLPAIGLLGWGFRSARADPIVRRATIALPGWPAGARPVRVTLLSDVHIGGYAMDAARLTRIVGQVNALRPDLVLIAGDLLNGEDPATADALAQTLVAPSKGCAPRWG